MPNPFYLTTTLPYVNAEPHIGFAFELVSADIIARYKKLTGCEVFFNTGTDEHGVKIFRKAQEAGKDTQLYVDEYAEKYRALIAALDISPDIHFIRTTDEAHTRAAQEFWRRCAAAGDIYKKEYKIKYCVGCELEKTDSELQDGRCPVHPALALEIIEEENYFFRLSRYQDALLRLYDERKDFVIPDFRLNEIRSLIREKGLEDFSISRLKTKMPWGVPVPNDDSQIMYVWFDALVDYISTLGWPEDESAFGKWWIESGGVVQFAGKDQIRQQAVMWQAMLMSAGLSPSKQIVIHGFIQSGGEKMSKSLGNTIDPFALVKEYGTDAVRFYLARHIHPFEDSDFTLAKFKEAYNADLANGVGNLVSRVLRMAVNYNAWPDLSRADEYKTDALTMSAEYMEAFDVQKFMILLWSYIKEADERIATQEPFKYFKTNPEKTREVVADLVKTVFKVSFQLTPVMPQTAETIQKLISEHKMPEKPIFPRR